MRVSVASLLACLCLAHVDAQSNNNATQPLVFNRADVVQVITMGDQPNALPIMHQVTASTGNPVTPEIRNTFLESLSVRQPFDTLTVTTPNVGPINVIKVKNGEQWPKRAVRPPPIGATVKPVKYEYIYGEYMILRVRSITNELVQSIRAPPEQAAVQGLVLTHTVFNSKVSSQSSTTGWDAEATVAARAEASAGVGGFSASVSVEVSASVRRSVSTTYESSQESTVTVTSEKTFTLSAPPGHKAGLWMSTAVIDVYVCKASTTKTYETTIDNNCHFSHLVKEEGKRYEITISQ